ncbi:MAG: sugar phosphate isomerase/epimerase [Bacteroidetes bacterium]|nr:MAG: sugar phosphate isomerase/epimerase [Bacteroidota bacterium]
MTNRRLFLKQAGAFAVGSLLANQLSAFDALGRKRKMGLQLFTFFPSFDQDVKGNLQKIADIGFTEIESAFSMKGGYYGMKPAEFRQMLEDVGLHWRSHHVGGAPFKPNPRFDPSKMPKINNLRDDAQKAVDEAAEGGVKFLVCASHPIETLDEVKQGVDTLGKAGEIAQKAGITLAYHNHDKEFVAIEGQKPYDIFLSQLSPDVLKMELDLAWVSKAGVDPVALFEQHPGRFPLWHVKDFDAEFKNLKPVGEGSIDFKRIFAAAKTAGLKQFFVEHDMPANAVESITSSYKYLSTIL